MQITPQDNTLPTRWSPSSLQRMTTCGYSYYQRYIVGHRSRQHAAAWFGGEIVHRIVERAYHGLTLSASFEQVWQLACAPIAKELREWLELDQAFRLARAGKRSDSKEAKAWLGANSTYGKLGERIDAYQRTTMAHLRWNERASLTDYYRRSALLLEVKSEEILLPNPWLVEGQWLTSETDDGDGNVLVETDETHEDDDEEKGRPLALLEGMIGGVPVCGIPDVVALRPDGVMLVGDYKTSARPLTSTQLSTNMQLIIYCELLRQNGILLDEQKVLVGHIYLTENEIRQVWADTSLHPKRLPLIERQLAHAESMRHFGDFVPVAGIAASFLDPCQTCDMAHVCDALLR